MDTNRFGALTKALMNGMTRRTALRGLGGSLAATGLFGHGISRAASQESTPVASPVAAPPGFGQEFLFVQTAEAGAWAPKPGENGVFTLTLSGAAAQTIYFSDRPDRIVGAVSMQQFLDGLGFTPDNPPNAALVTGVGDVEEVLVIELFNPVYDAEADTLTYEARVVENYQKEGLAFVAQRQGDTDLPESFGHTSLFIDDCNDIVHCYAATRRVGEVPGAPIGTCWHWSRLMCLPCNGESLDFYRNLCNITYPVACSGICNVSVE